MVRCRDATELAPASDCRQGRGVSSAGDPSSEVRKARSGAGTEANASDAVATTPSPTSNDARMTAKK